MRRDLLSVADVLVSYSAGQMPTEVLDKLHEETVSDRHAGLTPIGESFQILDLLLKVAIQKIVELEVAQVEWRRAA